MLSFSKGGFPQNPSRYEGGWITLAIAAASAIFGKKGKKKADQQAAADRARELALQERQIKLAEGQDQRAAELYGHYRDVYMPREKELVAEAFEKPISPARAEARSLADVRGAFTNAKQMQERGLRRLGVNPASGVHAGFDTARSLEEARIEGGSRTRAREDVRDLNFNRQAAVLGYASPGAASPYAGAAQSGIGHAATLAGARSRVSGDYAYEAGANYGASLGELADSGLEAWRNRRQRSVVPGHAVE